MVTNIFYLELMKKEIYRPKELEHGSCNSSNKNIFIDANGFVELCLHIHEIMPHNTIGNNRNLHLEDVWYSKHAQQARDIMFDCTKIVG
jgi:MoaA/NifB/PqqE/SkfB family radical SAM enzyme